MGNDARYILGLVVAIFFGGFQSYAFYVAFGGWGLLPAIVVCVLVAAGSALIALEW